MERTVPQSFVESIVDYMRQQLKPGQKIAIEQSNETMHLDLETGEMVSDSYEVRRQEIDPLA